MELSTTHVEWIERVVGGRVTSVRRTFGGGSRFTWLVDADVGGATTPLVLRVESGRGAFDGTTLTLQREAVVYAALQGTAARVPTLYGVAPDGGALLMSRAPGTSELRRLAESDARTALEDFVDVLAALHSIPVSTLDLPGFALPSSLAEHATNELDLWEQLAQRCDDLDLEIVYAFSWLRANIPRNVARTSLVHGDAGPGNFVVDEGAVSAVIDWEFAHVGDPVDDIAWFVYRASGRNYPSGRDEIDALLHRYEHAAGFEIDCGSLAYYRVFVQVRCAVTAAMTIARGGGAMGLAGYRVAHSRFVRESMQSVADAAGVVVAGPEMPQLASTPRTPRYDEALHELRDGLVPGLRGEAKLHARSVETLLGNLRSRDLAGAALDSATAAELSEVLGIGPDDGAQLRALAADRGATGDPAVLACLLRRAIRNEWMWSGAFEHAAFEHAAFEHAAFENSEEQR